MAADIKLRVREVSSAVTFTINETAKVTLRCSEGGAVPYTGDYIVTPEFAEQTLATKDKTMTDNVTIRAIPVSRTTNPKGGKTVYIGEI